jgi:GTP-binding protein LepA
MKIRMMAAGAARTRSSASACSIPSAGNAWRARAPGEVGFITAGIKSVADCKVGDTVTDDRKPAPEPLSGFKPRAGRVLRPVPDRRGGVRGEPAREPGKLRLNDASFQFEAETSAALGFGFRCGFLGLLHLEIIQERLEREFNLDLITTAPSVVYTCT